MNVSHNITWRDKDTEWDYDVAIAKETEKLWYLKCKKSRTNKDDDDEGSHLRCE